MQSSPPFASCSPSVNASPLPAFHSRLHTHRFVQCGLTGWRSPANAPIGGAHPSQQLADVENPSRARGSQPIPGRSTAAMFGRMSDRANLASRAARWSAAHRKAVILGWLALVVVAFALGSAAGMVTLTQVQTENGQSRLADETQARQFPRERSGEEVLIESPNAPLASSDYRAAVANLVTRLSRASAVAAIRSPLAAGNAGQVSKNGRAALLAFQITGDPDSAQNRVGPALAATAAVQRAYPQLFVGELGTASTLKAVNTLISNDFHKAEATSMPVTLFILIVAF